MEDMEAEILYDGVPVKTVSSTKETLFTFDNEWSMSGKNLTDGQHRITIRRKKGNGSIYAGSTLSYFSLEDPIPPQETPSPWNVPTTAWKKKR